MKNRKTCYRILAIAVPILVLAGLVLLSPNPLKSGILTAAARLGDTSADTDVTPEADAAVPPESVPAQNIIELQPEPISTPEPSPEPVFEEYDISLLALGDNLLHMGIVRTGQTDDGSYDFSFLFDNIRDFLDAADIKAINQETIFGGNDLGFSGFPRFNSPTEAGDAIAEAGFNVVLHATNHAADQGLDGILNCAAYWTQLHPEVLMTGITGDLNDICQADSEDGAPPMHVALLRIKDITFAILNYTYGPNAETLGKSLRGHLNMLCAWDEKTGRIDFTSLNPQVIADIDTASQLADVVVVFPHWGTEYQQNYSSWQQKFAQEMTQAGADLIIGTHPHVPQPVEKITADNGNTSLCYYSLGNYVSTQKQPLCMLEEMAWVTFHVTEDGVSILWERSGVLPLVCHYKSGPVRLEGVYFLEDYTEEQAARHGIRNYGGTALKLSDLQAWSDEIFGSWILKKSDILSR